MDFRPGEKVPSQVPWRLESGAIQNQVELIEKTPKIDKKNDQNRCPGPQKQSCGLGDPEKGVLRIERKRQKSRFWDPFSIEKETKYDWKINVFECPAKELLNVTDSDYIFNEVSKLSNHIFKSFKVQFESQF